MTATPVIAIGRPTFDLDLAADRVDAAWQLLDRDGLDPHGVRAIATGPDEVDDRLDRVPPDAPCVYVLQATFADSSLVARVHDRLGPPMVIWSFPEPRTGGRLRLNSLCGANLAAYLLRRRRARVGFVHVDPSARGASAELRAATERARALPVAPVDDVVGAATASSAMAAEVAASAATVGRSRIGVVGDAPVGFEPCEGDVAELGRITGLGVDRVALATLFDQADASAPEARRATTERVRTTLDVPDDVERAGLAESMRLHEGLRALAARHGWAALATRCWPECMTEYGGAMCTPMAMLTEDGTPSVCEADLFGAATALILRTVGGSDPFVADLVDAQDDDTSVIWHCGVAPVTLADPRDRPVGITHPNRHRALANQFALRPGRVTVARLSQSSGRISMVIGGGEMLDRPRPFVGTCGVVRWDGGVDRVVDVVFTRGLEHHLGVVYGDHRQSLRALAAAWGLPVISLDADSA